MASYGFLMDSTSLEFGWFVNWITMITIINRANIHLVVRGYVIIIWVFVFPFLLEICYGFDDCYVRT